MMKSLKKIIAVMVICSVFISVASPIGMAEQGNVTSTESSSNVDGANTTDDSGGYMDDGSTSDLSSNSADDAAPANAMDFSDDEGTVDGQELEDTSNMEATLEVVTENSKYALLADTNGRIALKNKQTNTMLLSNPEDPKADRLAKGANRLKLMSQLLVTYQVAGKDEFEANSEVACVSQQGLKMEKSASGVKFIYDFKRDTEQFKIPIKYTLEDDHVSASILASEILEYGDAKILNISLLPYFGAGAETEEGYILVPDGSGAVIKFNNGKQNYTQYSQDIYGRDPVLSKANDRTVEQKVLLPVYGVKKSDGGYLAIITNGAFLGRIEASVSGKGKTYNNAYCTFKYRDLDTVSLAEADWSSKDVVTKADKPNTKTTFNVNFYPLDKEQSDYSGMARKYRQYLMNTNGLNKAEDQNAIPFFIELYGGIKKPKSILGIPFKVVEPLTTYEQCLSILKKLENKNVNNIVLKYSGWMKGGMNDKIASKVKVEPKLGGNNALEKLCEYAQSKGVMIFPDAEFLKVFKSGNGFIRFFDASVNLSKAPAVQFSYKLSTLGKNFNMPSWYLLSPSKLDKVLEKFTKSIKKQKFAGISVGTLGNNVYSDFRSSDMISRENAGRLMSDALAKLSKDNGKLLVTEAADYAIPKASSIVNVPLYSSGFDVEDEMVPFYQMVVHGLVPMASTPLNLSSDVQKDFLKCVETGTLPYYTWTASKTSELKETDFDYLFSSNYEGWIEYAVNNYDRLNHDFAELMSKEIVSHKKLTEEVTRTEYENGDQVIVNYGKMSYDVKGTSVRAQDYLVIKGGH